jgi:hypothetical protein
MGIEKFFNSLASENEIKTESATKLGFSSKIETTSLYIDFNSIVYTTMNQMEKEINYVLWEIINRSKIGGNTEKGIEYGKLWNIDTIKADLKEFQNKTKNETLNKELLDRIESYIIRLVDEFIDKKKLKNVIIAVDGIPTISKMVEQKKRRYAGYLASQLKKKIYNEYKEGLSNTRIEYEENKISLPRGDITPHSDLMKHISDRLSSSKFKKVLEKKCPNMKRYEFSSANEFGEGEKKIAEDILEKVVSSNEKITLFSPDADVIILAMIFKANLYDKKNINPRFDLIRFNQQSLKYDFVNIDNLYQSIHKYLLDNGKKGLNKNQTLTDVCFLFTLFGNDFVPRIKSIDARIDFEAILKLYAEMKGEILEYNSKKTKYEINTKAMMNYFKHMNEVEKYLLKDKYMLDNYKNFKFIRGNLKGEGYTGYESVKEYVNKWNKKRNDIEHVKNVLAIEMNIDREKIEQMSEEELLRNFDMVKKDIDLGYRNGKLKFLSHKDSVNTQYHINNIRLTLPHPSVNITNYDKEAYSLDRQIGKYKEILNAKQSDYGYVRVDFEQNYYTIITNKPELDIKLYHKDIDIKNENDLRNLVTEYIVGVFWITGFYFNMNDKKENINEKPLWFFKQDRAPLINDIVNYYDYDIVIDEYNKEVSKTTSIEKYFNTTEHYIYVTPVNLWKDVPKKYDKVSNMLIDVDSIADKVYNQKKGNKYLDCRRAYFLNKCSIIPLRLFTFQEFKKMIRKDTVDGIMNRANKRFEKTGDKVFKYLAEDCKKFIKN